jgi:hypothetical protein
VENDGAAQMKKEKLDERLKEAQIRFSWGDRTRYSPDWTRRRGVWSESSKLLARADVSG